MLYLSSREIRNSEGIYINLNLSNVIYLKMKPTLYSFIHIQEKSEKLNKV
jgi:hypothetical protein